MDNIFVSQNEIENKDISGKVTYTNIMNTIPENKLDKPIPDWRKKYKTEWRWRFLKLIGFSGGKSSSSESNKVKKTERYVVEISFIKNNSNKRMYFNRFGQWVEREVDPIFDNFVEKEYYIYTNNS